MATSKEVRVINHLLDDFNSFFDACCQPSDDRELAFFLHRMIKTSKKGRDAVVLLQERTAFIRGEVHDTISRILKKFDDDYNANAMWLDLTTLISINGGSTIKFRSGLDGLRGETFEIVYSLMDIEEVMGQYRWLHKSPFSDRILLSTERWTI